MGKAASEQQAAWGRALRSMLERRGYRTHKEAAGVCDTSVSNLRRWYTFSEARSLRHGHMTLLATVLGLRGARDLERLVEIDDQERAGVAGRIEPVKPAHAPRELSASSISGVVDAMMRLGASRQTVTRFLADCETHERKLARRAERAAAG